MAIFIRPPYTLADSDADDEQLYLNRRALITGLATAGLLPSLASGVHAASPLPLLAFLRAAPILWMKPSLIMRTLPIIIISTSSV